MNNKTTIIVGAAVILLVGVAIGLSLAEQQIPVPMAKQKPWGKELVEIGVSNVAFGFGLGAGYAVLSPA